jgi:hypothetical protein
MVTERLGQTDRVEAALAEMDEQLRNTGVAPAGRPVAFQEGPADDSRARVRTGGRRELAGPGRVMPTSAWPGSNTGRFLWCLPHPASAQRAMPDMALTARG